MSRASSNLHVHQDNSVAERRLRPIYDWLDSGNNKKALQECEKVLKKTPNLHCAKALKAFTLHRMGREAESRNILETLTREQPTDDATLQAMTLCYREMQELDKICKLYETAVKLDPNNEEIHTHLFMSYVRIGDFKSQQQCAMALYKNKPKNPYYCWAIMSIVLQATRGEGAEDSAKRKLLLSLAERMFNKLIVENKVDAEQEVQLYIMILELLDKFDEILNVLDGPLGTKLQCSNTPQNRLKYLKRLRKWEEVNLVCKGVLVEHVDRWDIWKEYINSVFELIALEDKTNNHENHETVENDFETVDDTPEKAHEFICRVVENGVDNGYLLRGPYLARFELCSRLCKRELNSTDLLGDTTELFIEYFRKFGHKPCCVSDLRVYLNLLDSEKKTELSSRLVKDVGISSTSVPQTDQQMQRHICALQLSRLCGSHLNLSCDHLKALITALSLHYQHGYQTYGKNLLSTDLGPSDPYAIMAAHVLYDLALIEEKSDSIIIALILLENLLKNSPSNFHAKLLALRLYHTLGSGALAHTVYNSLDIKHLQLDSLGYIHCARLSTTGLFSLCTHLFDVTLKFFSSNYKDSSDHLTFSYKFGSFLKLDEFMDFRERLNNSLHYTTVAVDRIILSLMECSTLESLYNIDISPKDNNIDWKSLRDNHDLSVYLSWDPARINGPPEDWKEVNELFVQDIRFLQLRTSILWSLSSAIDVVRSLDGTRQKHIDSLRNVLSEWKKLYSDTVSDNFIPINQNIVTLPLPSRLHGAIEAPYLSVISTFYEFLISLSLEDFEKSSNCTNDIEKELSHLAKFVKDNTLGKSNDFQDKRKSMELVVNCIEIISICSLVCLLCHDLIKPLQGKKGKRRSADSLKSKELLENVANKIKNEASAICDILQNWIDLNTIEDIKSKFEALNLNSGQNVFQNILDSYNIANKEIQIVLKSKIKLLNGLIG
ncbi:hypothetical protein NQ315_013724 [Exocentrus adspersus]|uniref:N-terminal acetyltransferase B complex subunit MDM20 homolog n=1 Tax=Exocentrus adspersus TaxID=1586481 RepID=A0AAV8W4L0_9CUCU|nr:hypothetical protein NQ315_013724 [Exocentrus adspersus]